MPAVAENLAIGIPVAGISLDQYSLSSNLGRVLPERFLLAKLKTGDEFAWKKVFKELFPLAVRIAHRIILSWDDAEDIALDAMSDLASPGRIEEADIDNLERLRGYLGGIVRNKAKDFVRKKMTIRRGEGNVWSFTDVENADEGDQQMDAPSSEDLHLNVEKHETLSQIRKLLEGVPEKERVLVEGFYLQGYTYKELSETHGIPVGNIGVYLSRALVKIRNRMKMEKAL